MPWTRREGILVGQNPSPWNNTDDLEIAQEVLCTPEDSAKLEAAGALAMGSVSKASDAFRAPHETAHESGQAELKGSKRTGTR
jgi:hypothetical protein